MKNPKHNMSNSRLFRIWCNMRERCYNPNKPDYKHYGGRGIEVCDEWSNDFESFYRWAVNSGYSDELTIDRIDVNDNYRPDNCRWATRKEQANNKRNNNYITIDGITKTATEWGRISGKDGRLIAERMRNGYDAKTAVFSKDLKAGRKVKSLCVKVVNIPNGEVFSSMKVARNYYGLSNGTISYACKSRSNVWRKYDEYIEEKGISHEEAKKIFRFIA